MPFVYVKKWFGLNLLHEMFAGIEDSLKLEDSRGPCNLLRKHLLPLGVIDGFFDVAPSILKLDTKTRNRRKWAVLYEPSEITLAKPLGGFI